MLVKDLIVTLEKLLSEHGNIEVMIGESELVHHGQKLENLYFTDNAIMMYESTYSSKELFPEIKKIVVIGARDTCYRKAQKKPIYNITIINKGNKFEVECRKIDDMTFEIDPLLLDEGETQIKRS